MTIYRLFFNNYFVIFTIFSGLLNNAKRNKRYIASARFVGRSPLRSQFS
jgi:hypothetical protein